MVKSVLEDYAVQVINPHLKGLVREIRSREFREDKRISIRIALDPEDHARTTHGRPDKVDLETLTSSLVDSLARSRFEYICTLRFRSTAE